MPERPVLARVPSLSRPLARRAGGRSGERPRRAPAVLAAPIAMPSLRERDADERVRDFERTVLPHLAAAHNLACWLTGSVTTAEDLVQTACLRALRFFDGFRGDNPRAWLLAIVRNAFHSSLRERKEVSLQAQDDDEPAPEPPSSDPDPEALLLLAADTQLLREGIASLSTALRETLVLREIEGLSYKDIAEVEGVPIGTVMSRLARARRQLQGYLTANGLHGGKR